MQRTTRILLCGVMFAYGAQIARSQGITYDAADVTSIYAVGKAISFHIDTLTASANIGAPGQTSWDFSSLATTSVMILESVPVASTPFATDFLQATHALRDTAFTYSFYYSGLGTTVTLRGIGFVYYALGDHLLNYGLKGAGNAYLFGNPYPAQGQWLNSPASVEYALPLQFSRTWTADYTETISGNANLGGIPVPFGPLDTRHSITYSVDAYGTLTLPGGRVQEALRIRKVDRYGSGITDKIRVGYMFLAKNGATVQMTARDTSVTSGTVSVHSVQWIEGGEDDSVPIELASFTATLWNADSVKLEWTTLSETNNYGFYIQRRGADEREFSDLPGSFVAGHGTTIDPQKYSFVDKPGPGDAWWYRLKQVDLDGAVQFSEAARVTLVSSVQEFIPTSHLLEQNYPNPFNPTTTIRYTLPRQEHVTLTIFNTLGQQVAQLVNGKMDAGVHEVKFSALAVNQGLIRSGRSSVAGGDGTGLSGGVYFYRLRSGNFTATRKFLLVK